MHVCVVFEVVDIKEIFNLVLQGDKKRESTGGADLVSCTACTGPGACTHTANNGGVSEVTVPPLRR